VRRRPRRIMGAARGSDYWEIRGLAPSHAVEKKDKSHLGPQGSQARLATACLPQPSAPQLAKDSLGDSRRAACPKTVRDGARGGAGERWWWGLEDHQRPDCWGCWWHCSGPSRYVYMRFSKYALFLPIGVSNLVWFADNVTWSRVINSISDSNC